MTRLPCPPSPVCVVSVLRALLVPSAARPACPTPLGSAGANAGAPDVSPLLTLTCCAQPNRTNETSAIIPQRGGNGGLVPLMWSENRLGFWKFNLKGSNVRVCFLYCNSFRARKQKFINANARILVVGREGSPFKTAVDSFS